MTGRYLYRPDIPGLRSGVSKPDKPSLGTHVAEIPASDEEGERLVNPDLPPAVLTDCRRRGLQSRREALAREGKVNVLTFTRWEDDWIRFQK